MFPSSVPALITDAATTNDSLNMARSTTSTVMGRCPDARIANAMRTTSLTAPSAKLLGLFSSMMCEAGTSTPDQHICKRSHANKQARGQITRTSMRNVIDNACSIIMAEGSQVTDSKALPFVENCLHCIKSYDSNLVYILCDDQPEDVKQSKQG